MRGPFKVSSNPSTISSPISWNRGQMSALPQPFLGDSAGRGTGGRRGAGAWDAARPWKPSAAREMRKSRTDAQAAPGKAELALPSGSGSGEPCRASPAVLLRGHSSAFAGAGREEDVGHGPLIRALRPSMGHLASFPAQAPPSLSIWLREYLITIIIVIFKWSSFDSVD